jgi:hypothetical protein
MEPGAHNSIPSCDITIQVCCLLSQFPLIIPTSPSLTTISSSPPVDLVTHLPTFSTLTLALKMELAHSSKILLFIYNTTWYHYTDDYDLNVMDTTMTED